jgi:arsenic resistance protein ArsH
MMTDHVANDLKNASSNIDDACFAVPNHALLSVKIPSTHPPRISMLYGSLRERSYSKLLTLEAARLLEAMGAEVRVYDPLNLPQPDAAPDTHPKVRELRELASWSEGMVWCSPERQGATTGIMKSQIDWIPLPFAPLMSESFEISLGDVVMMTSFVGHCLIFIPMLKP